MTLCEAKRKWHCPVPERTYCKRSWSIVQKNIPIIVGISQVAVPGAYFIAIAIQYDSPICLCSIEVATRKFDSEIVLVYWVNLHGKGSRTTIIIRSSLWKKCSSRAAKHPAVSAAQCIGKAVGCFACAVAKCNGIYCRLGINH